MLWGQIATGIVGAGWAAVGTLGWLRVTGIDPRECFLTRPEGSMLRWWGVGFGLAGVVIAASMLDPGTSVVVAPLDPGPIAAGLIAAVATGIWSGTVEELLVRGVLLGVLGARWRWDGAVIVTALLFGLLHAGAGSSPAATASFVAVTTLAGLLLGLIVLAHGRVWSAVGIHAAWNASFAPPLLTTDPRVSAFVTLRGEPGWWLRAGGTAPSESPLAIALFTLVLYWYWMRRRSPPDGE